jgi:hypothetical protein
LCLPSNIEIHSLFLHFLFVPPGAPEAICVAAVHLICDPERRRRMGRAARSWLVENYGDRRILGLTVEF